VDKSFKKCLADMKMCGKNYQVAKTNKEQLNKQVKSKSGFIHGKMSGQTKFVKICTFS